MNTSLNVRIWDIREHISKAKPKPGEKKPKKPKTTYSVRVVVDGKEKSRSFASYGLAETFRSKLVTAQREGVPFDTEQFLPITMIKDEKVSVTFYEHAIALATMKWPTLEGGSRRTFAESLATVTAATVRSRKNAPPYKELFAALTKWAFNQNHDRSKPPPPEHADAIAWIAKNSIPVADLADPVTARIAYNATTTQWNGKPFSGGTATNKRRALGAAISYAIELDYLKTDPLIRITTTAPRIIKQVDRRVVANPKQARALLKAVRTVPGKLGPYMVAYFACMYFAGMRPGEVNALRIQDCELPTTGWGQLQFEESSPYAGEDWTDSGEAQPRKTLKNRAEGDGRTVPASPELVALLRRHIQEFGTAPDGSLFLNTKGKPMTYATSSRIWDRARKAALTDAQFESPLAGEPYALRHACVSTWLNGGVPATQVATWAGHSVAILLSTYAKCIDGEVDLYLERITKALGEPDMELLVGTA